MFNHTSCLSLFNQWVVFWGLHEPIATKIPKLKWFKKYFYVNLIFDFISHSEESMLFSLNVILVIIKSFLYFSLKAMRQR